MVKKHYTLTQAGKMSDKLLDKMGKWKVNGRFIKKNGETLLEVDNTIKKPKPNVHPFLTKKIDE